MSGADVARCQHGLRGLWRATAVLGIAVCTAIAPRTASAQSTPSAAQQAAAETLFVEGKQLVREGAYARACAKFAESQRLDPAAGTLLNLADCYERNGQLASAWVSFREAATASERDGRTAWAAQATARAQLLDARLLTLTIQVDAARATEGLEVWRDGARVSPSVWGTALPLDPSTSNIEVRAANKVTWRTSVTVDAEHPHVVVTVPPLDALAPPSPPPAPLAEPAPPRRSLQKPVAFAVAGAGVVSLGVGAAFGIVAINKNHEAATDCPVASQCPGGSSAVTLTNDAKNAATVSTVMFATGGALLAAGAVLFFTAPKLPGGVQPQVTVQDRAWSAGVEGRF